MSVRVWEVVGRSSPGQKAVVTPTELCQIIGVFIYSIFRFVVVPILHLFHFPTHEILPLQFKVTATPATPKKETFLFLAVSQGKVLKVRGFFFWGNFVLCCRQKPLSRMSLYLFPNHVSRVTFFH